MALQLRRKTHESIVYIDSDSAPRIMPSGEDFILEDLPVGTRVLYPNPPMKGLPNREAAIRYALNHPLGCDPLFAQLEPGMKVTIAVDDISLPLPPMATPDIRQTVLEIVLDMLAGHGVDDVHIIIANSLHRKMTPWEMKRMVGQKVYDEFYPDRYYNHDAEWKEGMLKIGETRHKEPLSLNRRAAESDLLIYCNINFVPMDGGHKSVAVGLCDYESLRAHHEPQTIRDSDSYMDPARSELSNKCGRLGKVVDQHLNVFHIETSINNRMYKGDMDFLTKNEDDFSAFDRMKFEAMRYTMSKLPRPARRKLLHSMPAQYEMTACFAGKTEPVHDVTLTPGSQLAGLLGCSQIGVNSTHHQAVGLVAPGLAVSAQSEDGVIEGLELKDRGQLPFLQSVQFHPERLYDRYPKFRELFRSFIRASSRPGRSAR